MYIFEVIEELPMLSFLYFSPEETDEKKIYFNFIIGFKSIIGYNPFLKTNLEDIFLLNDLISKDIKVNFLETIEDKKLIIKSFTKNIG